ncbi:hydroxyethylthiazole kinase [Candidatus Contubernalis alkalaceticus]|uniref:hydroxyethylthiazole kinase n=1 Tax=Candidatus Contubernalis alkaliaceticus TaxID=338645 RepID=UPI0029623BC2|nr:hydroxyethylthiazole kinase [Candidatus Contubernalis alkalaceticus]
MNMYKTIADLLEQVRNQVPLVHHITNQVVMNDCANISLHIGGSPVMAHAIQEVEEMVSMADCLILNVGTLTKDLVESMVKAGRRANQEGIPVLFDPVGAGATVMRTQASQRLLNELKIDIIKGNPGEISVLAGLKAQVRGVDSVDVGGEPRQVVKMLADQTGSCVVMTGAVDWVSDGKRTFCVKNGHILLSKLTGTGCILGSIIGAFASVVNDSLLASLSGLVCLGIAAEVAAEKENLPASFKRTLFDEVYAMDREKIIKYATVEEV